MSEQPRRLHPITPVFTLIANARQLLFPVAASVIAGQWYFLAIPAVLTVVQMVEWFRYTYHVDGDVIRINEGLFVRKQRTVSIDRVQQVDVVSKLRHRVIGVVGLHVDTASGAKGAELKLEVVSEAEGARLRELFVRTTALAEPVEEAPQHRFLPKAAAPAVVETTVGQLALAGMTGAQTLVILTAVVWVQELGDFVDLGRVRDALPAGAESSPLAIVIGLVMLAVVWLGLAALTQIFTHFEFRMTKRDDEFHITRGLLDKREVGAQLRRVQAVRVEQTLPRRLLGFCQIRVQTAAIPGQTVSKIVIPFVSMRDVERVVAELLPTTAPWPTIERAPQPALWLALLRRVPPTALAALCVTGLFFPWGALAFLAVPVAVFAAFLHWNMLGYALRDGTVWARRGGFFVETSIVPGAKAQSLRQTSSPLQRSWSLATVRIDVAGEGGTPRLQDAPVHAIEALMTTVPSSAAADERLVRAR